MDRNSLNHPQEYLREGDDAFGEELAGVAGETKIVVHPTEGIDP